MPFLASYLIYRFTVPVVNNHVETSWVVFKPFYFSCAFVLSLVSRAGCSREWSVRSGFCFALLLSGNRRTWCLGAGRRPLATRTQEEAPRAHSSQTAGSSPLSSRSRISCRRAEIVEMQGFSEHSLIPFQKKEISSLGENNPRHSLRL